MKISFKYYQKTKVLFIRNFLYLYLLFFTISCQTKNKNIGLQKRIICNMKIKICNNIV